MSLGCNVSRFLDLFHVKREESKAQPLLLTLLLLNLEFL